MAETPFTLEEESRLIERAQRGDRAAFGLLVQAYRDRAFGAALVLTQNHEDARDLSQDAFVRCFGALDRFHLGRPFYPWLYRILRNLCLSHLQKHSSGRQISLDAMWEDSPGAVPPAAGVSVVEKLQQEQMAAHLREAISQLKPEFREIICMQHFDEMRYEEIAATLRIPIGTVMSRLFHARKQLAKLMEKHRHE